MTKNTKALFLLIAAVSAISVFATGFVVRGFLPSPTPTPKPVVPDSAPESYTFEIGKHYYLDTIIAITGSNPRHALAASTARQETADSFNHSIRASFYNGTTWTRDTESYNTADWNITPGRIITSWSLIPNADLVLRETASGAITVNDNTLSFETGQLNNEIAIRSIPGYTKFMSQAEGFLTVNGQKLPAKIIYTKIYSQNSADVGFWDQTLGITTHWLAFWTDDGSFYHIDQSTIDHPTTNYQPHSLAVYESPLGAVSKVFELSSNASVTTSPATFGYSFSLPQGTFEISARRDSYIDKSPNGSYTWQMGLVDGTVTQNGKQLSGFGLSEYINKVQN